MSDTPTTPLTVENLSLPDQDWVEEIKDILQARYGPIEIDEPVLHLAVANAAASQHLATHLKRRHERELDNINQEYEGIRTRVDGTLLYFEKNITDIIKRQTLEVYKEQLAETRNITRKQLSQMEKILDEFEPPKPPPQQSQKGLKILLCLNTLLMTANLITSLLSHQ